AQPSTRNSSAMVAPRSSAAITIHRPTRDPVAIQAHSYSRCPWPASWTRPSPARGPRPAPPSPRSPGPSVAPWPTRRADPGRAATVASMKRTWTGDVVVVGAGSAGANAAGQLARRGRSVLLLERRPLARAGADWSNGVVKWQFDLAGVAMPSGDERTGEGRQRVHLRTPDDEPAVVIDDNPLLGVDM